jgi:hypothetical protein
MLDAQSEQLARKLHSIHSTYMGGEHGPNLLYVGDALFYFDPSTHTMFRPGFTQYGCLYGAVTKETVDQLTAFRTEQFEFCVQDSPYGDPLPDDWFDPKVWKREIYTDVNAVECRGGWDTYLSRLTSKKRSEVLKVSKGWSVSNVWEGSETPPNVVAHLRDEHEAQLRSNCNRMEAYQKQFGYYSTPGPMVDLDSNAWVVQYWLTTQEAGTLATWNLMGCYPLVMEISSYGEPTAYTLCMLSERDSTLYTMIDVKVNPQFYTCKSVTAMNIKWAAERGLAYVDFENSEWQHKSEKV